ncbi:MAG: L,D-transpeptidase [Bacteroidales bacterium]|nr:L,D-transpeptidase [Bacteroidales bacterium]
MKNNETILKIYLYVAAATLSILILLSVIGFGVPALQYHEFTHELKAESLADKGNEKPESQEGVKKQISALKLKLENLSPGKQYLVINSTDNTFKFYRNGQLVRKGICSTGSYIELKVDKNKTYRFRTPKGVFTIKNKIVDPVWKKPDWAFIEDGVPIPPANDNSRFQYGVLGDYALNLGNGYLIHGTLYQRFLGLSVTHGCIRMDDDDLKFVYENLPVGAKVFIY